MIDEKSKGFQNAYIVNESKDESHFSKDQVGYVLVLLKLLNLQCRFYTIKFIITHIGSQMQSSRSIIKFFTNIYSGFN